MSLKVIFILLLHIASEEKVESDFITSILNRIKIANRIRKFFIFASL